jgi:hypothetical protein
MFNNISTFNKLVFWAMFTIISGAVLIASLILSYQYYQKDPTRWSLYYLFFAVVFVTGCIFLYKKHRK